MCKYKNRGFDSLIQKNCGPWFIVLYAIGEIEFGIPKVSADFQVYYADVVPMGVIV